MVGLQLYITHKKMPNNCVDHKVSDKCTFVIASLLAS